MLRVIGNRNNREDVRREGGVRILEICENNMDVCVYELLSALNI